MLMLSCWDFWRTDDRDCAPVTSERRSANFLPSDKYLIWDMRYRESRSVDRFLASIKRTLRSDHYLLPVTVMAIWDKMLFSYRKCSQINVSNPLRPRPFWCGLMWKLMPNRHNFDVEFKMAHFILCLIKTQSTL